jgi:hypothetical protein
MSEKKTLDWLKLALHTGGVIDTFMVLIFLVPTLRVLIFGEDAQFHTPQYEWAMRLVASLGLAWTIALFWAARKPLERKAVLLLTVFPLMFGAYGATVYGFMSNAVASRFLILFSIVTFTMCPFFVIVFLQARKLEKRSKNVQEKN